MDNKNIKPVTQGQKVKQKSFFQQDLKEICKNVGNNVIIPALKQLLYNTVSQGTAMTLWGTNAKAPQAPKGGVIGNSNGTIPYNSLYNQPQPTIPNAKNKINNGYVFSQVYVRTFEEAQDVMDQLRKLLKQYQAVSVADLYQTVRIEPTQTDFNFGWTDLSTMTYHVTVDNLWQIDMPMASSIV